MKDFLLIFRNDYNAVPKASAEEAAAETKKWMDWIGGIAAQNKLADRGNKLSQSGKVLRPQHVITDGPYTEIKEAIGGYTAIKAGSLEEAVELAKGCPILLHGGNVEIREIDVI